jgi:hypothetical protein
MNRTTAQIAPPPIKRQKTGTLLRKRNPIRPATKRKERARQFRASREKGTRLIRAFFKFLPMSRAV